MKKTILVIGVNSALAKQAIEVLSPKHNIIAVGRKECDVTKPIAMPENVNVVINFAAAFGGDGDDEILNALNVNALGMVNICIGAKKAGVSHIINLSSLSAVLDESSPYYSIYAITKRQGDELAEFCCAQHKIALTILRPSQIYGDDDSFANHQPLFYNIVDHAKKGEDVVIYGQHDASRNYIHALDLAELIKRVVEQRIEGVYPCVYPSNVTFSEIARTAQKIFNKGGDIVFAKDKADILDNVFESDLTIYDKAGFKPQISIEDGILRLKRIRERKKT